MAGGMPPDGGSVIRDRLTEIMLFLDASASEMARKLELMLTGEGATAQDVAKELAELKKWAQIAYEERNRIDRLVRDNEGGTQEHEIDFADARAQIGRRLDRLRAAGGSGEVPR
ncbi:MAG: hypothetical protein OEM24_08505 [Paracoccaceae bacterium]|nr:hypothetical protein [Paracoccaceae bacterium]